MTKAAAPMIGGMICPPVEATASTAPANSGRKPVRFISGMLICPVTMTLATALPEMVPNRLDETTATLPGPPVRVAGQAGGEIHEQLPGAGALHEGAEHHEDQHIGRRHRQRDAEDAFGCHIELVEHALRLELRDEQPVDQKHHRGDRHRPAEHAARRLQQHQRSSSRP